MLSPVSFGKIYEVCASKKDADAIAKAANGKEETELAKTAGKIFDDKDVGKVITYESSDGKIYLLSGESTYSNTLMQQSMGNMYHCAMHHYIQACKEYGIIKVEKGHFGIKNIHLEEQ